jgi:hypothetical protein
VGTHPAALTAVLAVATVVSAAAVLLAGSAAAPVGVATCWLAMGACAGFALSGST